MAKNFKQLKGKFGRVLGFPYDPKQDPLEELNQLVLKHITGIVSL